VLCLGYYSDPNPHFDSHHQCERIKTASITVSWVLDKKAYLVYLIQLIYHSHLTEGVLVDNKLDYIFFSCACSVNKVLAILAVWSFSWYWCWWRCNRMTSHHSLLITQLYWPKKPEMERLSVPAGPFAGWGSFLADKPSPTPTMWESGTILASGRCQLTCFSLLPSYVVDGSSPKQPWKGSSQQWFNPPDESFCKLETAHPNPPFTCPCVYCMQPQS